MEKIQFTFSGLNQLKTRSVCSGNTLCYTENYPYSLGSGYRIITKTTAAEGVTTATVKEY